MDFVSVLKSQDKVLDVTLFRLQVCVCGMNISAWFVCLLSRLKSLEKVSPIEEKVKINRNEAFCLTLLWS